MTLAEAWVPWLQGVADIVEEGQEDPPPEAKVRSELGGFAFACSVATAQELGLRPDEDGVRGLLGSLDPSMLSARARGQFMCLRVERPDRSPVKVWLKAPARRKASTLSLPTLDAPQESIGLPPLDPLLDIQLEVAVVLGSREMTLEELATMGPGQYVALSTHAGDPVLVKIQGKPFAWAEVLVIDDQYAVRIIEVIADPAAAVAGAP